MKVNADKRLNPDASGRSLPTLVQILQLKGLARLDQADFASVFQHAQETLGPDFLRVDELTIDPGGTDSRWFDRDPKTTHVVAVGVFRQPSGDQWRSPVALSPVPPEQCIPTAVARTGNPRRDDAQVQFDLEEFRISSPNPREVKK